MPRIFSNTKPDDNLEYNGVQQNYSSVFELLRVHPELRIFLILFTLMLAWAEIKSMNGEICYKAAKAYDCYTASLLRRQYDAADKVLSEQILSKLGVRFSFALAAPSESQISNGNARRLKQDWYALKAQLVSIRASIELLKGNYVIDKQIDEIKKLLKKGGGGVIQNEELRELINADLECYKDLSDALPQLLRNNYSSLYKQEVCQYAEPPQKNTHCGRTYVAYFLKGMLIKSGKENKRRQIKLAKEIVDEACWQKFHADMISYANKFSYLLPRYKHFPLKVSEMPFNM